MDRHDVVMLETGRGPRLPLEALDRPSGQREPGEDLQRDRASERDLIGLVHDSHPASTKLAPG